MPRTETYKDHAGEWRWRRVADNGEVIATSGEGYKRRGVALDAAEDAFPDDDHHLLKDAPADPEDPAPGTTE